MKPFIQLLRGLLAHGPGRSLSVILGLVLACTRTSSQASAQAFATNTYTVSTDDFANPERGFLLDTETYASSPSSLPSNLASLRVNGNADPNHAYTAKISLVLRLYYLDSFVNSPISSNCLNQMQADFNSLRTQGDKVILRFAYNTDTARPFNEPTKAQILQHIGQLQPLLQKNSDVIAALQEGFIGAWGEGYYTDNFYTTNGQATAQNWADRADVLNALLAALPATRMIQVRVPQMKQKYVYGPAAPTTSVALDGSEALSGDNNARVAFHNDCFLADNTDSGTFANYDVGGSSSGVVNNLRNYLALETRYAVMGGETCSVNPPGSYCSSAGGRADSDMALFHYSFLNELYDADVDDAWATQGCIDDIIRELGYRFQLVSGIFRTEAQPGQAIPLTLTFQNVGFAAPYNPRGLELVLSNAVSGQKYFAQLSRDTDVRRWLPGSNQVLNARLSLPVNLPLGSYDLLLHLPDPATTLYGVVPYTIRLANSNALSSAGTVLGSVWDPTTGYHRLRQTLTVNATATNSLPDGTETPALSYSAIIENYALWKARNFSTNAATFGGPNADPDGDGNPNLFEYAVGSNPNSRDNGDYLKVTLQGVALVLTVQKGPGVKDVSYEVESSPDPASGNWTNSLVTILDNNAAFLRASFPVTNTAGFLRLKVALVP